MSDLLSIVVVFVIALILFLATGPAASNARGKQDPGRGDRPTVTPPAPKLLKPGVVRLDALQRLRTDRRDLQISIGREFGAPELGERIWPPVR